MNQEKKSQGKSSHDKGSQDAVDPLTGRAALWRAREEAETGAAELIQRFREDLEQLLEPVRTLVEAQQKEFEQELDQLSKALVAEVHKSTKKLRQEIAAARREVQNEATQGRDLLDRELDSGKDTLLGVKEQSLRFLEEERAHALTAIDDAYQATLRNIRASGDRRVRALRKMAAGEPASEAALDEAEREPWEEETEEEALEREAPPLPTLAARRRTWRERLPSWVRSPRFLVPVLGAALLLLVLFLFDRFPFGGRQSSDIPAAVEAESAPSSGTVTELRTEALERLRGSERAAQLLHRAAGLEPVQDDASRLYLEILLGSGTAVDEIAGCALVQNALSAARVMQGESPIGVDGECGTGTRTALAAAVDNTDCQDGAWTEQAACFLNRQISTAERRSTCPARWPFQRDCPWQPSEVAALFDLVRKTGRLVRRRNLTSTAAALARYDLAADPTRVRGVLEAEISDDEARGLLRLAYAAERAAAGQPVALALSPDESSPEQLQAVLAFLEELPPLPGQEPRGRDAEASEEAGGGEGAGA